MRRTLAVLSVLVLSAFVMRAVLFPGTRSAGADDAGDLACVRTFHVAFPPVEDVPAMAAHDDARRDLRSALPAAPRIRGRDPTSHGRRGRGHLARGLTLALPFALPADGESFRDADLRRLARTVVKGFGLLGGAIPVRRINGATTMQPSYVRIPATGLRVADTDPAVRESLEAFCLRHKPVPGPCDLRTAGSIPGSAPR